MKRWLLVILMLFPFLCMAGSEVGPEGYKLLYLLLGLALIPFFIWLKYSIRNKQFRLNWKDLIPQRPKLKVSLTKDRPLRPKVLTLRIKNDGKHDADINQPVLVFRKLWSFRRFALKGVSGRQIYPLYLVSGDIHELKIETSVFHQYDKSLRKYYWARVLVTDVKGRKFRSKYVKLRKSLFT